MRKAVIAAIETYLPESLLPNEQLARELGNWDAKQIFDKTGIAARHIAGLTSVHPTLGGCGKEIV